MVNFLKFSHNSHHARAWTLFGQLSLLAGIAISTMVLPQFAFSGGGISNYGAQHQTVYFFSAGFVLAALGALVGGYLLYFYDHHHARFIAKSKMILALLYLLVLSSSYLYQQSASLKLIHQIISVILFLYMTLLGVYLSLNMPKSFLNRLLLISLIVTAVIGVLTFLGFIHLLFVGEVIMGMLFGLILIRYLGLIHPTVNRDY